MPAPYQPHTTRPYLTNRTYRQNAGALPLTLTRRGYPAGKECGDSLNDQEASIRFLLRDHDAKFTRSFDDVFKSKGGQVLCTRSGRRRPTPCRAMGPDHTGGCLDWTLVLGRRHLLWLLRGYVRHNNRQRPHRGLALAVLEAREQRPPQ